METKFRDWVETNIGAVVIFIICSIVSVFFLLAMFDRHNRHKNVMGETLEFGDDTVVFINIDTRYVFTGSEIDTLMSAFDKANRLAKFTKRNNVRFNYEKELTRINGIVVKYDYRARPFYMSTIMIYPTNLYERGVNSRFVILFKHGDFKNYLTKYRRIYEREKRKTQKIENQLNKI